MFFHQNSFLDLVRTDDKKTLEVIQLVLICGLIFFTVLWYFDSFDPQWLVSSFFSVTRILINAVTNISIDLNIDFAQMTTK